MYIKQKSNIIFRNYNSFGYITDNRNFGYINTNHNEGFIGDKILSDSGAAFFSVLDRKPQNFNELVNKINQIYTDVDICIIKEDARDFYNTLENEGFIITGKTAQECEEKDIRFSYQELKPEFISKNGIQTIPYSVKSTQDFFEEYSEGKPQLTSLHVEIISKCNERCIHCYIPHENKTCSIDPVLFYNVLKQCCDMNLLHLTLSGGEPMLHKNFCDFLRKCEEFNFSVNVLSNLTLLDEDIINVMKTNPLLGVQVSLYSMNPEIHDEITQLKGSFEKTIKGILKLLEHNIPMQISCPIMKQNKNCSGEVIKWAQMNNIPVGDDYVIIAKYNHSTSNLNCRLSFPEVKNLIIDKALSNPNYLERMKKEADKQKSYTADDFVCSVCHSSICLDVNGNVYPCAGWQDYVVGNINKSSLKEIWDNSPKVQYLRNLRKKDFPKCIKCSYKEYCTMCMVRNANENPLGNPLIVNEYYCKIAKLNKGIVLKYYDESLQSGKYHYITLK